MEFELRKENYVFKHQRTEKPATDTEQYPAHLHSQYEVILLLSGDVDALVSHNTYKLEPKSLLVVPPGEMHNIIIKTQAPYERVIFRFDSTDVCRLLRKQVAMCSGVYSVGGTPLMEEIMRMEKHVCELEGASLDVCARCQINIVLSYLCAAENLKQQEYLYDDCLFAILRCIEENLTEIHSMEELCVRLHMSPATISRIFSGSFELPIMSYVRTQKVLLGRELLRDGIRATEACQKCGFRDYTSFYRAYKKMFSLSPSEEFERSSAMQN